MRSKKSIQPTYDSRKTGLRYHVTTTINNRVIGTFRERIADPFVRQTVTVTWLDLLHGLLRGRVVVEVMVGGDPDVMNDVLELDANALVPGRSRRADYTHDALAVYARGKLTDV